MLFVDVILGLCVLIMVARSFIVVPAGKIAIREIRNHFRALAPGIHLRMPWHSFVEHPFHLYRTDTQTYRTTSQDGSITSIRIAIEWTEFQGTTHRHGLDLMPPIRSVIRKYPISEILSSPKIRGEIEWAIRATSHESGCFFFQVEVLSVLQESMFESADVILPATATSSVLPPRQIPTISAAPRQPFTCIVGGKHGHAYRLPRKHLQLPAPPYLRLYKEGNDDGAA